MTFTGNVDAYIKQYDPTTKQYTLLGGYCLSLGTEDLMPEEQDFFRARNMRGDGSPQSETYDVKMYGESAIVPGISCGVVVSMSAPCDNDAATKIAVSDQLFWLARAQAHKHMQQVYADARAMFGLPMQTPVRG
jgi:hypothetical protein